MTIRPGRKPPPRIIIIGAGIGGLTAGALLADAGYAVTILEAQAYPGGSAGTFYHNGYRYDAGATLAGGFQPEGPHALIGARLGITWPVREVSPAWVVHLPDRRVVLARDRGGVHAQFPQTDAFWREQTRIADRVWKMSAQGLPWPPATAQELAQLVRVGIANFPDDLHLLPFAFQTAQGWLRRHGLEEQAAFRRFVDAQLLISAQTTSAHANALYSATALDLARQGVYHVEGGIGGLACTLVEAIRARGGQVLTKHRVTSIEVSGRRASAVVAIKQHRSSRRFPADMVIANLTPGSLNDLLGQDSPASLRHDIARCDSGWGAFVLHVGLNAALLPSGIPDHHQVITSMDGPLGEGRSIFVSMSPEWDASRAPAGRRAVTVSTHTAIQPWWELLTRDRSAYEARKAAYAERMIAAISSMIPEFHAAIESVMTGTPVTYNTWTHRHRGMVGGFPAMSLFAARGPRVGLPNVRLVGDSIFPGQSTAGVTLGAMRVAADIMQSFPRPVATTSLRLRTAESGETVSETATQ